MRIRSSLFSFFLFRLSKYILWLVLTCLAVAIGLIVLYAFHVKSTPDGTFAHQKLRDQVKIQFDHSDIAHIKTNYPNDAYFALGYLHARERSWQMEFNRRLASGTLSEVLGEKTISIDRFIKTIGVRKAARMQFEQLPSGTKLSLESYSAGVSAGYADLGWALPLEFLITGTQPGLWTPIDSVSWSIMMALDLGDNWGKEFSRLQLAQTLSTQAIWEVMPPYVGESPTTSLDFAKMYHDAKIFLPAHPQNSYFSELAEILAWLPQGSAGKGSNNWVVAGSHSANRKPLLANDPHLGLASPSSWYFAHLQAKDLNVIGGTIPGLPGVVLGYTPNYAWGFTNTAPDVQDLYIEALHPQNTFQYKTPQGYEAFQVRRETIFVKGAEPIHFVARQTRHGPVISDAFTPAAKVLNTKSFVLALRWSALDPQNQSIRALLDINKATSLEEFRKSLGNYYAPMQNVVMADTQGKIAFMVAGVAPKRPKNQGMMGVAPVFGWEASHDWKEYLKPHELPHDHTSVKPFLVTANQKIENPNSPHTLTADWTMPYRANRIQELLEKNTAHDLASMRAIQNDHVSLAAKPLLELFKNSRAKHPLAPITASFMQDFDGAMNAQSAAALLFQVWVDQFTRIVFSARLGPSFDQLFANKGLREGLLQVLKNNPETWCRPPDLPDVSSCSQIGDVALDRALSYLSKRYGNDVNQWQWGSAHPAIGAHRPFGQIPVLQHFFNLKIPSGGDSHTINVGQMNYKNSQEPYSSSVAAGMRAVYDLSQLNASQFIGFGGQSGWVHSSRYRNYLVPWSTGVYLPMNIMAAEFKPYEIKLIPK